MVDLPFLYTYYLTAKKLWMRSRLRDLAYCIAFRWFSLHAYPLKDGQAELTLVASYDDREDQCATKPSQHFVNS